MNKTFEECLANAETKFASERYEDALKLARTAFTLQPGSVKAYVIAGNCCFLTESYSNAEKYFRKAAELDPQNGEHYFLLGNALFAQERLSEARNAYASAEQLGCDDASKEKILYIMGMIDQVQGRYQDALVNYRKADTLPGASEDQMDILLNQVEIYKELGDLEQAEHAAIQLKLLIPSEFSAYQLLFQLQLEQRKFDQAMRTLKEAEAYSLDAAENRMEYLFDHVLVHCFKAEAEPLLADQHYSNALHSLSELENYPELPVHIKYEAAVTRAEIYLRNNQIQQCASVAAPLAELDDEDLAEYAERSRFLLMEAYSRQKDYPNIHKYAGMLIDSEDSFISNLSRYYETYAFAQMAKDNPSLQKQSQHKYDLLIAYYKNRTVTVPGDYIAHLYRAMAYVDTGRYDDAKRISALLPTEAEQQLNKHIEEAKNGGI